MDIALAFKAKVNNSYESEPSSGSGSSLGDNNDYLSLEVESLNLPSLLKPRTGENSASDEKMLNENETEAEATTPAYLSSSQESPFKGFSESPFEKEIRSRLCNVPNNVVTQSSSNKVIAEKYYDAMVADDSCNAVYMPISQENQIRVDAIISKSEFTAAPLTAELSFNGRIKGLKIEDDMIGLNATINAENEQFSQSFVVRDYTMENSPDLFADEEEESEVKLDKVIEDKRETNDSVNHSINCPTESSFADDQTTDFMTQNIDLSKRLYRENCKRERELLKRIRKCLSGVPPPPSMTTPQVDLVQMVLSRKDDIFNFFKEIKDETEMNRNIEHFSLFRPTHTFDDVQSMPWRDILGARYHGVSYNLSKASESNEYLGLSVIERFIGSETNSSYRRSPSSAKKRSARLKLLTQSPGNRLSHLAKRRAIFSSANLATTSQKSTSSLGPQIVIDNRKVKNRRKATPKRRTPGSKRKARKTPSSSARKRLFRFELSKHPGPSRETSKRALFQSPARQQLVLPKPQIKPEIANRVEKSKRALFSPVKEQQSSQQPAVITHTFESLLKRKRSDSNYDDDIDELSKQNSKLQRTSENLTPRALKIKSQSFCIGAGSSTSSSLMLSAVPFCTSTKMNTEKIAKSSTSLSSALSNNSLYGSNMSLSEKIMTRAHSDMAATATTSLTENQRKKLLWAVSQALQEKKITTKHESFKQYASVLARVVRRIFQEYYQRTSTSNSETMLRLAKKYVYYVTMGKSADEIYLHVKAQLDECKRMSATRLSGYIGPEEYQKIKQQKQQLQLSQSSVSSLMSFRGGSMQNLFSNENSIDCNTQPSQTLSIGSQSQIENQAEITKSASKQKPIDMTSLSLRNSSSKSNLGGLALRENSAQKNFTGKDQRNRSPYANNSALKTSSLTLNDSLHAAGSNTTTTKAKRQILFDS